MSLPRFAHAALAVVAILIAVACGEAVAPRALTGTYVLASIDGSGPPLTVMSCYYSDGGRFTEVIAYDSLTFTSDSTVHHHWQLDDNSYYADGTSGVQSHSLEYSSWFARTGDEVIISRDPFGLGTDTLRFDGTQLSTSRFVEFECDEYSGERHLASFVYRQ